MSSDMFFTICGGLFVGVQFCMLAGILVRKMNPDSVLHEARVFRTVGLSVMLTSYVAIGLIILIDYLTQQ